MYGSRKGFIVACLQSLFNARDESACAAPAAAAEDEDDEAEKEPETDPAQVL